MQAMAQLVGATVRVTLTLWGRDSVNQAFPGWVWTSSGFRSQQTRETCWMPQPCGGVDLCCSFELAPLSPSKGLCVVGDATSAPRGSEEVSIHSDACSKLGKKKSLHLLSTSLAG